MLSRGSGTLLESRNTVRHDWKRQTRWMWLKGEEWREPPLCEWDAPVRRSAAQWVWPTGGHRGVASPGSGTRCPAAPWVPARCLHRLQESDIKVVNFRRNSERSHLNCARRGCKRAGRPCRWSPGACCWRTSGHAGSAPPPRASVSTWHQTPSVFGCHQAKSKWLHLKCTIYTF